MALARSLRRGLTWGLCLALLGLGVQLAGCGGGDDDGGWSGGGGTPAAPVAPAKKVVVSGTVRDVSGDDARLAARADLPGVGGVHVEVSADLNDDGAYSRNELFGSTTDGSGFFAVTIPDVDRVSRVRVKTMKAGFSDFIREYTGVEGSLVVAPSVSEGELAEIDLSGVTAGPARAGRKVLASDELVTLSLVRDRGTGRRVARVARGSGGPSGSDAGGAELLRVAFPVRGLDVPAASDKIYANLAYLDTVNDSEVMPGGFKAEGEGKTPVDILSTYGASQIRLYDAAGRELMNDPNDRSKTIQIKMVVPPEAYGTINDENPATDQVEIPLFYYDEVARTWKLHKNADQSTAYGWLEDSLGHRLTRADLADLQQGLYSPGGDPAAAVTIYGVGTVNHFTTWNCDRAGRSSSMQFILKDKNGKNITADVRYRKGRGGNTSDSTRPKGGKGNLHTDYDRDADSLIKKLLDKKVSREERALILATIQSGQNVYAKQAVIEALRRYAENLRDDIASGDNELERGIRAIFNNKSINDAFINTDGLDCTKTPDICNGVLGVAVETVNKSTDAQKAVAFLMQIAVDSYNPSNLDFAYAVDKGVEFLDTVMGMDGVAAELKGLPEKAANAKELAKTAKELRAAYKSGTASFKDYWEAVNQFKTVMEDIKNTATALGGRAGRVAARAAAARTAAAAPTPTTPQEEADLLAALERDALRAYGEVGGLLLGSSQYDDSVFGYYQEEAQVAEVCFYAPLPTGTNISAMDVSHFNEYCVTDPTVIAEMIETTRSGDRRAARVAARRVGAKLVAEDVVRTDLRTPGGGQVGELEYFNGTEWVPLEGRSDLGVDASFVPVPRNLSFGAGSRAQPMMFLGTWNLDVEANVEVTGRLLTTTGAPARRATVFVGGQELTPDAEGRISGKITAFATSLEYRIPGANGGWVSVAGGKADLGDVAVPDAIVWAPNLPGNYTTERNAALTVSSPACALSGDPITYTFRLRQNYWDPNGPLLDEKTGSASTYGYTFVTAQSAGYYYLEITASTGTLTAPRSAWILVVNRPPAIQGLTVTPAGAKVGDEVRVSVDATDPDDLDPAHPTEIQYRTLWVACTDPSGRQISPWLSQEVTPEGVTEWVMKTQNNRDLYSLGAGSWTCSANATVYDRSYGSASRQESFSLAANPVDPEVVYTSLSPEYTVGYYTPGYVFTLYPAYLASFDDKNGDLDHYEVDCGNGALRTGTQPITEPCEYNGPGDYTIRYEAFDRRGGSAAVTTLVHYLYPLRMTVAAPSGFTAAQEGEGLETVYELPPAAVSGQSLAVSAVSDNGSAGYGEGAGSISELHYSLIYQPGNSWWPQYLAGYEAVDSGTVPVNVDKPGTYTLNLWARDSKGIYASFGKTFKVTAPFDGALTVDGKALRDFLSSGRTWFMEGEEVTFDLAATGPDGWTPDYEWTADDDATPLSTTRSLTRSFTKGTHTVRVSLRNPADTVVRKVVRDVTFEVYPPVAVSFATAYEPVVTGEVRLGDAFTVTASFPGGETITSARWTLWKGGAASGGYRVTDESTLAARTFVFTETGTYQLRVELEDARGVRTTAAWDKSVTAAAHAPAIASLTATPASGRPPLAVDFAVTASDADARPGEALRYRWLVDGQFVDGASGPALRQTFGDVGTYTVTAQVVDTNDLADEKAVTVEAKNLPPAISTLVADTYNGRPPLAVNFTVTASDPDAFSGEALQYQWSIDGQAVTGAAGATLAHTFSQEGTYTVRARVTDASGLADEKSVTVTAQNQAPSISDVRVAKTSEAAPSTVTFTAVASDSDGTIASYAWSLKVGDAFQTQTGSGSVFSKTFQDPGTYTVKVKVTDDGGKTAERTASVVLYDASEVGVYFEFKERRADGFGPDYDFTAAAGLGHMEGVKKFAATAVDDVTVTDAATMDLAPKLGPFPVPGFYGLHRVAWGSPSDVIFLAGAAATHTVGLVNANAGTFAATETPTVPARPGPYGVTLAKKNAMLSSVRDVTADAALTAAFTQPPPAGQYAVAQDGSLTFNEAQAGHALSISYRYRPVARFPGSYACGTVFSAANADSFGLWGEAPVAERSLYLTSEALAVSGQTNVVAILGSVQDLGGGTKKCAASYYGFASGSSDVLTLPSSSRAAKPVQLAGADAASYGLSTVSITKDGVTVRLDTSNLDTSAEGAPLVPYVAGADYRFEVQRWIGDTTRWLYAHTIPAGTTVGDAFVVDVSGIVVASDVTVQGSDPTGSLRMGWRAGTSELWTATALPVSGGTGPLGDTLELAAATEMELRYEGTDAAGNGRSFLLRQAAESFNPALDLAAPAVTSTLTGFGVSVDEAAKTITVDFQTNGAVCGVWLHATYNDPTLPNYQSRDRYFAFVADGSKSSYTVGYPIGETANPYNPSSPIPAIDALTKVEAEARCGRAGSGYAGSLAGILAALPEMGYLDEELFVDKGGVTEYLGEKAVWHK